jgi:hypothetical protein
MVPKDAYLKLLLHELPSELPEASLADYPFISFQPNPNKMEDSLSGAVSNVFKNAFGWGDALPLKARGQHIEAAADVLFHYREHEECRNNLAPITVWIEKLTEMAQLTYKEHRVQLVRTTPRCNKIKFAERNTNGLNMPLACL